MNLVKNLSAIAVMSLAVIISTTSCKNTTPEVWEGIYHGIVPCADCEGIEKVLILNQDSTYTIKSKYLGEENNMFEENGTIIPENNGKKARLLSSNDNNQPATWIEKENGKIILLDLDGKRVTGQLATNYELTKIENSLIEKNWTLTALNGREIQKEQFAKVPFIRMNYIDQRVTGNGSCNNFFGTYTLFEEDGILLSRMGSTMMACPNMVLEGEYLKALESVERFKIEGNKLSLSDKEKNIVAIFTLN